MDFTKIKIIKKLGVGILGTNYLINYDKKKYALKIQKILEKQKKKNYKIGIWREIDLYKYIDKMPVEFQKFFCKLYAYKILDNCSHKQVRTKEFAKNGNFINFIREMNDSTYCIVHVIDYKGNTTLYDYLDNNLSIKQIYSILLQICKIVLILTNGKYSHNDLHPGNIMVLPTKEKTFEIMGYDILYHGIQLVAIDYGNVTNERFNKKYKEDEKTYYFMELTKYLFNIIFNQVKLEKDCRKQKKKYTYEKTNAYKTNFWKNLLTFHKKIVNEYANKYLKIYPNLKNFYLFLLQNFTKFTIYEVKNKFDDKNNMNTFLYKIEYNFALEYPEEYMKMSGWCSLPEFTLPKNEVLQILECKNEKEYVELFFKNMKKIL